MMYGAGINTRYILGWICWNNGGYSDNSKCLGIKVEGVNQDIWRKYIEHISEPGWSKHKAFLVPHIYTVAHKTVPMFCCFGQKCLVWDDDTIKGPETYIKQTRPSWLYITRAYTRGRYAPSQGLRPWQNEWFNLI